MNIERILKMSRELGVKHPEIRIRHQPHSSDPTYHWQFSVIENGQVSGPSFAQESSDAPEKAAEFVENSIVLQLKKRIAEHEGIIVAARKALSDVPEDGAFTTLAAPHKGDGK